MTVAVSDSWREQAPRQSRSLRIVFYCVVAFGLSALHRFVFPASDVPTGPLSIYRDLIGGLGPALGALGIFTFFNYRSRIGLWGSSRPHALAMIAVPAIVIGSVGVPNRFGLDPHLFGVELGGMVAVYGLLEELGWRGYLQDELRDRPALLKYTLVGLVWYAWHFSWIEHHPIGDQLFTIGFMVLASIGIGFVADRTRSVLAAAAFHIIGDVMGLMPDFHMLIPSQRQRVVIVASCVVLYLLIMRLWRRREIQMAGSETPGKP